VHTLSRPDIKERIVLCEIYGSPATCQMGSHSAICHPTEVAVAPCNEKLVQIADESVVEWLLSEISIRVYVMKEYVKPCSS